MDRRRCSRILEGPARVTAALRQQPWCGAALSAVTDLVGLRGRCRVQLELERHRQGRSPARQVPVPEQRPARHGGRGSQQIRLACRIPDSHRLVVAGAGQQLGPATLTARTPDPCSGGPAARTDLRGRQDARPFTCGRSWIKLANRSRIGLGRTPRVAFCRLPHYPFTDRRQAASSLRGGLGGLRFPL